MAKKLLTRLFFIFVYGLAYFYQSFTRCVHVEGGRILKGWYYYKRCLEAPLELFSPSSDCNTLFFCSVIATHEGWGGLVTTELLSSQMLGVRTSVFNGSWRKDLTKEILSDFIWGLFFHSTFFSVIYSYGGFSIEGPSRTGSAVLL